MNTVGGKGHASGQPMRYQGGKPSVPHTPERRLICVQPPEKIPDILAVAGNSRFSPKGFLPDITALGLRIKSVSPKLGSRLKCTVGSFVGRSAASSVAMPFALTAYWRDSLGGSGSLGA
jgi:hypothetical protein